MGERSALWLGGSDNYAEELPLLGSSGADRGYFGRALAAGRS